ncbi:unnamed protein product [Linum tenue]|uniref:Pentatricopeptide repeat-containing protein n=1 Tax=Linum tenue TaxID=586396 RepID=A0AAV0QKN9_9ROSI|nr:unnamed protein product [Linum tenue]
MEMALMANGQVMGISHSETSCSCRWRHPDSSSHGFLKSRRPIFAVPSSIKSGTRLRKFGRLRIKAEMDNQATVEEKDLDFKPSFGEYLKAMEAVKTGREKRQIRNFKDPELKADVNLVEKIGENEARSVEGDEANESFNRLKGLRGKEKPSISSVKRNDELRKSDGGNGPQAAVDGKLYYEKNRVRRRESDKSAGIESTAKVERKTGGVTRDGKGFSGRMSRMNHEIGGLNMAKVDKMENVEEDSLLVDDFKSNSSNIKPKETGNYSESSRGIWLKKRNVFEGKEVGGRDRRTSEKRAANFLQVEETTSYEIKKKNEMLREKKMQNVEEDSLLVDDFKSNSSNITTKPKETGSYSESSPGIWLKKRNVFEGKEVGGRNHRMSEKRAANFLQVEETTSYEIKKKNEMLHEKKRLYLKNSGDTGSEVDRAAFTNLEKSDYVASRLPASKREMEDRVQKLANWLFLFDSLNGADIDMPEWMFSKMMRSARIRYTDHTVLRIIQILGKLGNWRRVIQVIEWLQMRDRFKSHKPGFIHTTALHVLGKAGRPVEALNLFYSMQKRMSTYPDLVAYHSIAVTLGQAGYMKELFDVIDSMRSPPMKKSKAGIYGNWDPTLEPDVVIYNAVLNACVKRKQWEGAFWVLQQLKEQNQKPSTATYGLVMEVMFACEKYNLVHEFFRKLQKSSLPNALAYRVLVNTLWKEGKTDEAVLTVQEMERRGIVGSAALYYDLARCLCSSGRCEEALTQIEKICKVANKPLVVTYTGLVQACLEAGRTDSAAYIFDHMKQFCSPNLVTCNIMLKGYLDNGRFEEAKTIFHRMSEDSKEISNKLDYKVRVVPDIYTFNTMLDACVAEQRWDDFVDVYGGMLQYGYHFNAKRHLRMILEAARAGKEEVVEMTWKHLARTDRVAPPPIIKERLCMMLKKCNHNSALACIAEMKHEEEIPAFSMTAWSNLLKDNSHRFSRETVVQLVEEGNMLVSGRNTAVNRPLQNLLTACDNFLRTSM